MDLIVTILPVVTKDLPISPRFTPYDFLSRCKFSTLITRQPMVEFYLLTFPRFPFRKKEHKSYFGKNRTHDFRTSRCAGYLLDHSGDESKEKSERLSSTRWAASKAKGGSRQVGESYVRSVWCCIKRVINRRGLRDEANKITESYFLSFFLLID